MNVQKSDTIRALGKTGKTLVVAVSVLGVILLCISCSGTSQRYHHPAPGTPPSFENDYGRPEPEEKIFNRSRGFF